MCIPVCVVVESFYFSANVVLQYLDALRGANVVPHEKLLTGFYPVLAESRISRYLGIHMQLCLCFPVSQAVPDLNAYSRCAERHYQRKRSTAISCRKLSDNSSTSISNKTSFLSNA